MLSLLLLFDKLFVEFYIDYLDVLFIFMHYLNN